MAKPDPNAEGTTLTEPSPNRAERRHPTPAPIVPLLYRAREVSELLGVGRSTVYDMAYTGVLETVMLGTSRRFVAEGVHAYLDQLRAKAS
jgi:excisionase family DNA binding protein